MSNKVTISILALLVIVTVGASGYSYRLSMQVDALGRQLTAFQAEQAARSIELDNKLTTLREETLARFSSVDRDIDRILSSVANELSPSLINVNRIYATAKQVTVRVSDGERTVGSGFIFDGTHVVTAYHVVESLSKVYVILPDGRVSMADTTCSCKYSDVAVLTVEGQLDIEPPTFGDSATVTIGQPVVAIGNPFDLTETVTSGVISHINRFEEIDSATESRRVANLIQFDAAANFGNSGGALFNSEGDIIGMVVARVNPNRGDGISYAISSNVVKKIAVSLIERGFYDYPWLGAEVTNLTPEIVLARGLETTHGALVEDVQISGPARTAGVKVDDIIVAIDGTAVRNIAELVSYVAEYTSGDESVTLTLIRDTTTLELPLILRTRRA
jgi:serine protease Do